MATPRALRALIIGGFGTNGRLGARIRRARQPTAF